MIKAIALVLVLVATSAQAFTGRVAISHDGNMHDCDDIFAAAVDVAMLAKTGNQQKLVWYAINDHHWKSEGGCNDGDREQAMRRSAMDTAVMYGGFDMAKFHDARADLAGAVSALASAINASSAADPLTILAGGPMDLVGQGIAASDASKRKYVTLVSHSNWNNDHDDGVASRWTWADICSQTQVKCIKITDQNGGLSHAWSDYHDWRDGTGRLSWLWSRAVAARSDWPDCSDAGMTYWLLTNKDNNHKFTTPEVKAMLAESGGSGLPAPVLRQALPVEIP